MAKVTAVCGRICCGKTSYANKIRKKTGAVLLSIDEVMLALFGRDAGDMHDTYAERTERFLLSKAAEIVSGGVDVVLDWGLWTSKARGDLRKYFSRRGIPLEICFIDISEDEWRARIERRNRAVFSGDVPAYIIDKGLMKKFASRFEAPAPGEVDIIIPAADT